LSYLNWIEQGKFINIGAAQGGARRQATAAAASVIIKIIDTNPNGYERNGNNNNNNKNNNNNNNNSGNNPRPRRSARRPAPLGSPGLASTSPRMHIGAGPTGAPAADSFLLVHLSCVQMLPGQHWAPRGQRRASAGRVSRPPAEFMPIEWTKN
jgi:hypothetical protein